MASGYRVDRSLERVAEPEGVDGAIVAFQGFEERVALRDRSVVGESEDLGQCCGHVLAIGGCVVVSGVDVQEAVGAELDVTADVVHGGHPDPRSLVDDQVGSAYHTGPGGIDGVANHPVAELAVNLNGEEGVEPWGRWEVGVQRRAEQTLGAEAVRGDGDQSAGVCAVSPDEPDRPSLLGDVEGAVGPNGQRGRCSDGGERRVDEPIRYRSRCDGHSRPRCVCA